MSRIKLLFLATLSVALVFTACKKEENNNPGNNNNNPSGTSCADGNVCFKAAGTAISKPGSGYYLADTFLFVKYEEGSKQLSLDIFGNKTDTYTVSDKRKSGNARIYWFPENDKMYMAEKGNFNVSELTSDNKITGTFSGTLYRYDSDKETFTYTDSVVIADGNFTKIQLFK